MSAAKREALARGDPVQMVPTDWRWWPNSFVEQNPYKVGVRRQGGWHARTAAGRGSAHQSAAPTCHPPMQGVTPAPGSALYMLLSANNKETGTGLKDVQIAAQCHTLIAGARCRRQRRQAMQDRRCGVVLAPWVPQCTMRSLAALSNLKLDPCTPTGKSHTSCSRV